MSARRRADRQPISTLSSASVWLNPLYLSGIAGVVVQRSRDLDVNVAGSVVIESATHEPPVFGHRLHPASLDGVPGNLATLGAGAGGRGRLARRFCPLRDA